MMGISMKIWNEASDKLKALKNQGRTEEHRNIEPELLFPLDYLTYGDKNSYFISCMVKNYPEKKWMNSKEIVQKYPAFENLPEDYVGNVSYDAGNVKVKNALNGFRILSETNGADLRYNSEVTSFDKSSITLTDGTTFTGRNVVICCGPFTIDKFDKNYTNVKVIPTETINFGGDLSDLPGIFYESSEKYSIYSLRDKHDFSCQKFGIHGEKDTDLTMEWAKERIPSKVKEIIGIDACFYTVTEGHEFIYKTNPDGVHYGYGLNGEGFKYMPAHGKIIYDGLITGDDTTYLKQLKAKI
ncbi:unnamed protein product [Moneuplotes crassus]|uniref:FAD dependent oxidoreductase domain-containing protein n=2 Tax=Euplotes crassus TaxID=5936 RepID=A0AAD1XHH3_EUPCR|nr:unnamed protein product [Moneuplotes crassus]